MAQYSFEYGISEIKYILERKNIKNINIRIKGDGKVYVSANKNVPAEYITETMRKKAEWIVKYQTRFTELRANITDTKKEYISGEAFRYLGRQYRLKVEETDSKEEVNIYEGFIRLYVRDMNNYKRKEKLISEWYKFKTGLTFKESMERVYPLVEKYGIKLPEIKTRKMKSRWGSCMRNKNQITLNSELVKAPKSCLDYVVLHELVHFKHRNHDSKFYNFLTTLMPDWKERKKILNEEVVREF